MNNNSESKIDFKTEKRKTLVSLVVFAYNQEQYIREAIEGALSQTYHPLEIVLSDDCSTDKTFKIMEEMAKNYCGNHKVIVRKNITNLCTVDHVLAVSKEVSGELMVVAAGDDISKANRVKEIVEKWDDLHPVAIISDHDTIEEDGCLLEADTKYHPIDRFQKIFQNCVKAQRYDGLVRNIPGYCAAYDRNFVASLPPSNEKIFNEDALLSYLANLEGGGIEYIPQSLLMVRISRTSVSIADSDFDSIQKVRRREEKIQLAAISKIKLFKYMEKLCLARGYPDFPSVWATLVHEMRNETLVADYYSSTRTQRILRIITGETIRNRRFAAIRIFGCTGLYFLYRVKKILAWK